VLNAFFAAYLVGGSVYVWIMVMQLRTNEAVRQAWAKFGSYKHMVMVMCVAFWPFSMAADTVLANLRMKEQKRFEEIERPRGSRSKHGRPINRVTSLDTIKLFGCQWNDEGPIPPNEEKDYES
jgi:hypothetical protein